LADVEGPPPVILPQITIARGHWLLGALFLAVILEEYVPRVDSGGRPVRSRSVVVPWALMVGAVGVWVTVVVADVVHDILVHFLWGDILFAAGAFELARRRGVYERRWLDGVLPATFLSCGALFIVHVMIDPSSQGAGWHLAMGLLLIVGGLLEFVRLGRRRAPLIPLAVFPLSAFALALIAIPVAAAS
jgi:membrane protein CcdC involved in cytochrome C biogenesis